MRTMWEISLDFLKSISVLFTWKFIYIRQVIVTTVFVVLNNLIYSRLIMRNFWTYPLASLIFCKTLIFVEFFYFWQDLRVLFIEVLKLDSFRAFSLTFSSLSKFAERRLPVFLVHVSFLDVLRSALDKFMRKELRPARSLKAVVCQTDIDEV